MNFQNVLEELNTLYESDQLEEAGAGFRLDNRTMLAIEDLADEVYRGRGDDTDTKEYLETINKDITIDDLKIAVEKSDYPRQIKTLIAHMNSRGFKTIGDFANSFENVKESLVEEADEDIPVEEIEDDESRQVILECDNCGALVIKGEADVKFDEASDLVDVGEACAFCEEAAGYKVIGVVAPYEKTDKAEKDEEVEEVTEEEVAEDEIEVSESVITKEPEEEVLEEGLFSKKPEDYYALVSKKGEIDGNAFEDLAYLKKLVQENNVEDETITKISDYIKKTGKSADDIFKGMVFTNKKGQELSIKDFEKKKA